MARIETKWDAGKPWEGLGADVSKARTAKEILKLAKIDWSVEKRELAYATDDTYEDFKNHFALVRSSDGSVLDVVGNRYLPTQNIEGFTFLDQFVRDGKARFETAGALNRGRIVWGLANLDIDFTLPGGDKVRGYLFVGMPHMQGRSLIVRVTTLRDVCNNTLSIALRTSKHHGIGDVFRMNHRLSFDDLQQTKAKEVLGIARDRIAGFGDEAKKLAKRKISENDAIKLLAPIFQPKEAASAILKDRELLNKKMEQILDANKNAPGAQPGTAWGLLNAVTYYADHMASRTIDKRMTNAWAGRTASQKEAVLDKLLELA